MADYDALGAYLSRSEFGSCLLSFDQIESIIGDELPTDALHLVDWWGNAALEAGSHRIWMNVGWRVDMVNFDSLLVRFRRAAHDSNGATRRKN